MGCFLRMWKTSSHVRMMRRRPWTSRVFGSRGRVLPMRQLVAASDVRRVPGRRKLHPPTVLVLIEHTGTYKILIFGVFSLLCLLQLLSAASEC